MSNNGNSLDNEPVKPRTRPRRSPALIALVVILALEGAAVAIAALYFVYELLVAPVGSLANAIALIVVLGIAAVWIVFIVIGLLRGQAWTRAATIVVQALIAAIAIGSFQGANAQPVVGTLLLVPAIVALVLLFTKSVVVATNARGDEYKTF